MLGEEYRVHVALNVNYALEILESQFINLIVSDVMMPGLNGFEFCSKLKSDIEYCHIPVILLTAKNTYKAKIEGLENGADAYIEKPFSPELLLVQIANLLKNRSKIKDHSANVPFEEAGVTLNNKSDEKFLRKVHDYIRKNLNDRSLDIDSLAKYMNMSPHSIEELRQFAAFLPRNLLI